MLQKIKDKKQTDHILKELDELLLGSKFGDASAFMIQLLQHEPNLSILLSVLTLTYSFRNQLPGRQIISEAAKQQAFEIGGEDKVKQIERFL